MMIEGISWLALAAFGALFSYLTLLSVLAFRVQRKRDFNTGRQRRFAVVVPAHNEESGIVRTLESLQAIGYPKELYTIVVIADNCTDRTAEIAAASGAMTLRRSDKAHKGKGFALEWGFRRLLEMPEAYEAFVVIDADSVVSGNLLAVLNAYLSEGHAVMQVADIPEPRPGVWSAEIVRVGMTLYNVTRPLGKRVLGCSAGLRGNGMCFVADLLRAVPWSAHSLTEDLEYGLQLLERGLNVSFVPEASVYAAQPSELSSTQRERWEAGRISVVRRYVPRLLRQLVRRPTLSVVDALLDLVAPPFVNAFAGALALALTAITLAVFGLLNDPNIILGWCAILLIGVLHVVLGLAAAGADKHLFRALAYVPRYAAWKMVLYGSLLTGGIRKEWIRTTRE